MDTTAPPPERSQGYHTETFDIRRLTGREVTILGAGSVGGYVAFFLGPAHLVLNIVDLKKVESRHTEAGRTIYDRTQIGLWKVHAAKQKVERDHAGTTVNPYPFDVAEIPDRPLMDLFARSQVVIVAIDDPRQVLRVNDRAYAIVELIQVAMHREALTGHLALSRPCVTPCLRCTLHVDSPQQIHRLDSERGNSLDIVNVAQLAARIALDIVYSKVTGRPVSRWDTTKNLIFITNTKQDVSPDGPGLTFEGSRSRPGCPICGNYSAVQGVSL
jgi:hypothetical protein